MLNSIIMHINKKLKFKSYFKKWNKTIQLRQQIIHLKNLKETKVVGPYQTAEYHTDGQQLEHKTNWLTA